uniref:Pacifastin domain-containing protein n=1 Tax=Biomphalaria glabrata TaxID=6526 RepID=A0A2C9LJQ2_BIOGL
MGLNSTLQCFCVLLILSCFIHQSETGPVMSKKVQETCLFKGVEYEDRQFVPIPDTNCELCSCYKKQSVYCYGGSRCLETKSNN